MLTMEIFTPKEHRRQRIALIVGISLIPRRSSNHCLDRDITIAPFRTGHTVHIRITHNSNHPRPEPIFLRHRHHSFSPSNRPTFGPCVMSPNSRVEVTIHDTCQQSRPSHTFSLSNYEACKPSLMRLRLTSAPKSMSLLTICRLAASANQCRNREMSVS